MWGSNRHTGRKPKESLWVQQVPCSLWASTAQSVSLCLGLFLELCHSPFCLWVSNSFSLSCSSGLFSLASSSMHLTLSLLLLSASGSLSQLPLPPSPLPCPSSSPCLPSSLLSFLLPSLTSVPLELKQRPSRPLGDTRLPRGPAGSAVCPLTPSAGCGGRSFPPTLSSGAAWAASLGLGVEHLAFEEDSLYRKGRG